jgi:hypothetical protein
LLEGQWRRDIVDGVVTIRVGNASAAQTLARRWFHILIAAGGLSVIALWGFLLRDYYAAPAWRRAVIRPPLVWPALAIAALVAFEVVILGLAIAGPSRPTTLTASPAGLTLRQPGSRSPTQIPRADLESLFVVPNRVFRARAHKLVASTLDGTYWHLVPSGQREDLERLRATLMEAMGLANPPPSPRNLSLLRRDFLRDGQCRLRIPLILHLAISLNQAPHPPLLRSGG